MFKGVPPKEKLDFVTSPLAMDAVRKMEGRHPPAFATFFPHGINPQVR